MKMNFVLGLLLLTAIVALATPPEAIQRVMLDERAARCDLSSDLTDSLQTLMKLCKKV